MAKFIKSIRLGSKTQENSKKGAETMNKEEVQALIKESMEPIESKLDDVLKAMKSEVKVEIDGKTVADNVAGKGKNEENKQTENQGKDEEQQTDPEQTTKSKADNQEEGDDYKEKYEQVLKQLENRPFSHRLVGQDGVEKSKKDEEETIDRNAFGFKRK